MIEIKNDFKGRWHRIVNLYLCSYFRKIANDAFDGTTGPNNGGAGGPKDLGSF